MTEKQKEEIREIIENKVSKLKVDIEDLKQYTKPIAPENSIGRISRMDAINNKSINEAALLKRQERLKKLEYALTQIHEKDFGFCVNCSESIEWERMKIFPEGKNCIQCLKLKR